MLGGWCVQWVLAVGQVACKLWQSSRHGWGLHGAAPVAVEQAAICWRGQVAAGDQVGCMRWWCFNRLLGDGSPDVPRDQG